MSPHMIRFVPSRFRMNFSRVSKVWRCRDRSPEVALCMLIMSIFSPDRRVASRNCTLSCLSCFQILRLHGPCHSMDFALVNTSFDNNVATIRQEVPLHELLELVPR